ncbi:MAG: glycosyl hydrolase family 65 protein [Acidimicrobiales bacterium]
MTALGNTLRVERDGWLLVESGWNADRAVAIGSNFSSGNGYLGYRGTAPEQGAADYMALVVTDTYDCADGHWTELATVPNPLFVAAAVDGVPLAMASAADVERSLDLADGRVGGRFSHALPGGSVDVSYERLASYDRLHVLAQRWTLHASTDVVVDLEAGIDTDIWSLNGRHLPDIALAPDGDTLVASATTVESGIDIVVAARTVLTGGTPTGAADGPVVDGDRLVTRTSIAVAAGTSLIVDSIAAVVTSNDTADPRSGALDHVAVAAADGYDALLDASRTHWDRIWSASDVEIDGDVVDQACLRFSLYHNRICTPAHTDHLPVGARGLSCQAYQGSAFWDQEVYNLPAFLFTEPEIARSILIYRHRTLDGARRKAARLGYDGAYYAWISGLTGDELCPDVFFTDVLTGRPIRNHFNVWQMHVAPDVVTTLERYVEVTGDVELLVDHGAEIAFEVARFLRSFVRYDDWRGVYHCIRLLGPDEWHENVDDNAFTNHQTAAALRFAVATHERLAAEHPDALAALAERIGLHDDEVDGWRRVRDHIVLPEPGDDGLIEQFAGFFDLEDITPAELRTRLLHPQEYWGWPNGIAVHTQVSKQADIAMLLWLHRERFDDDTALANYTYYEPRCSHDSSLSHAAHGMVAVGIGDAERAHAHFRRTATVDLLNTQHAVVGGTFIGGIHTAACGGTAQLAVQGFGGLSFADGRLRIDPLLPSAWTGLRYPITWRGARLTVNITRAEEATAVTIEAAAANPASVELDVLGRPVAVPPGAAVTVG